jgi:hypothetical protein
MSQGAQNMKTGLDALSTAENGSGRAKTVPDAVDPDENEFNSAKHENGTRRPRYHREPKTRKRNPTPSVPPKMNSGAQNIKTAPDALGTTGIPKQGNGTRRPRYRQK